MPVIQCSSHGAIEACLVSSAVLDAFAHHVNPALLQIVPIRVAPFDDDYVVDYWCDVDTAQRFGLPVNRILSSEEFYVHEEFLSELKAVCYKCFTAWREGATRAGAIH